MGKSKSRRALESLVARVGDLTAALADYVESLERSSERRETGPARSPRRRMESKTRIVELFVAAPGRSFTAPEVARKLRLPSKSAVRFHLMQLSQDGLLTRVQRGVYTAAKSPANGVSK